MTRTVIIWGLLLFSISAWSSGQPSQYQRLVNKNALLWDLPAEIIQSVIYVESRFNPEAISLKGAIGLMQVVPESGGRETWRQLFSEDRAPSRQLLKDPGSNIMIGTAYLAHLYHNYFRYIQDRNIRIIAALAGYNWGPGRVKKMLQQHAQPRSTMEMYRLLIQHSPQETAGYVIDVLNKTLEFEKARLAG
mgnify:CR=1 FL=1